MNVAEVITVGCVVVWLVMLVRYARTLDGQRGAR